MLTIKFTGEYTSKMKNEETFQSKEPGILRDHADIQDKLLELLKETCPDEDCSNINPDVRLRDQVKMESMDFLDLVMMIREEFGIRVPEEDYLKILSLRDCTNYIMEQSKIN